MSCLDWTVTRELWLLWVAMAVVAAICCLAIAIIGDTAWWKPATAMAIGFSASYVMARHSRRKD